VKMTKRVRLEDLGLELSLLLGKIGSAARSSLSLQHVVTAARSFCPVDTGALSASVRAEVRGPYEARLRQSRPRRDQPDACEALPAAGRPPGAPEARPRAVQED
jgi:hypothetical protein